MDKCAQHFEPLLTRCYSIFMHTETTPQPSGKDDNDSPDPNSRSSSGLPPPRQAPPASPEGKPTWSRRRFLAAAAAGLGILVGACDNGEPSLDAASLSATSSTPGTYNGIYLGLKCAVCAPRRPSSRRHRLKQPRPYSRRHTNPNRNACPDQHNAPADAHLHANADRDPVPARPAQ